ncbi:His Kinase A (phospho-acceptor) domain-containing protein [Stigmatella aurantiaca]|uniref:histidine kinase n=1 Tax=Stigmatella aurantiaca TaxID=41 RepID=A0A1H7SVL5_STIAU|nr:ATP-binding protein [Stigmatella aurantiaca]SEL76680.1 His Kinase A (phospho-acceptor) domain-containing protein [Stigmatella aurantiaca]
MPSTPTASGPGPGPEWKILVFAALMPLLTVLDFLTLSRFIPSAFVLRVVWGLVLAFFAFWLPRASEKRRVWFVLGNAAWNAVSYLLLVFLTGALESPYVYLVFTLPLVVAFAFPEERNVTTVCGVICFVGTGWQVWVTETSFSQGSAWLSLIALSTFLGEYGSSRFRKELEVRNEVRVERTRREAAEKFARAVRHQTQSEKLATVGRLAANVMHEINNPLAFVRSNLHFLQKELLALPLPSEVRGEFEEVLTETRTGLDRIQQIVADLRGFSRMDVEEPSPCLLADVVDNAVRLAGVRLKHVAHVKVEVPRELPSVFAVSRRLVQVLLNLLVNAGDAIEESGREGGTILVRGEVQDAHVVLTVEDDGPGFPPEVLPRLFETFFTTKGPEKGTGLGLVISRELLAEFGATLSAENRAEGGARLRIVFP